MAANENDSNKMRRHQQEFIEGLIEEMEQPVAGMLYKMTRDVMLIEDVMVATWTVACQKITQLSKHENPQGWIMRTAKLQMLQALEENNKCGVADAYELEVLNKVGSYLESGNVREEELKDTLKEHLKEDESKAIILRFFYELSYTEMADYLHCSEIAVRKRVSRALSKLRKAGPNIWHD